MRVAIHQPNVLPWFGFFAKLAQADVWIALDDVPFSRESYTHRVGIAGPSGQEWLSWPVGGQGGALIRDVILPTRRDASVLCDRVYARYAREKYGHSLGPLLSEMEQVASDVMGRLGPVNAAGIATLSRILGRNVRTVSSSTLRKEALPGDEGCLQLCRAVGASTYVCGDGGANYANAERWKHDGIELRKARFTHPVYPGMPAGGLSIVDCLARHGPKETAKKIEEACR